MKKPSRDFSLGIIVATSGVGKPVLGICRGLQMINVAMVGTPHQDLGAESAASARRHFRPAAFGDDGVVGGREAAARTR